MDKYKQFVMLLLMALISLKTWSMQDAKVLALSQSGRTIKLDIGKLAGLKPGDIADVSVRYGELEKPRYLFLGTIELLKVSDRDSHWYFKKVNGDKINRNNFQTGKDIKLQIRSIVAKGRKTKTPHYLIKGHESKRVMRNNRYAIDGVVPSDLVQEKGAENDLNYKEEHNDPNSYEVTENSILKSGNEIIVKDGRIKYKYINSKLKPIDVSELSEQELSKDIGVQNQAQLEKISAAQDGYEEMYYTGTPSLTGSASNISIPNTMEKTLARERAKNQISKATKAVIDREGPLYSADMNSKQLANYLKASGIAREKYRRENVLAIESGNEIQLSLMSNLLANYSDSDPNHQNLGYGLAAAYEFHLIRAHHSLGKWSVDFGLDASNLNVDLGGINGRMTFVNISTHVNYYFFNAPYIRNKLLAYIGFGFKRGTGEVTSPSLSAYTYDYEAVALPSLSLGIKTRISTFRDFEKENQFSFGLGAKLNYELLNLSPLNEVASSDQIYELNQKVNNVKFIASLSVYF